jgi:drug/metabolite transporter superfamily protein YnfA
MMTTGKAFDLLVVLIGAYGGMYVVESLFHVNEIPKFMLSASDFLKSLILLLAGYLFGRGA